MHATALEDLRLVKAESRGLADALPGRHTDFLRSGCVARATGPTAVRLRAQPRMHAQGHLSRESHVFVRPEHGLCPIRP